MIWVKLKTCRILHQVDNKMIGLVPTQFRCGFTRVWETIPYFAHCAVFNSIPKRVRECIANDGETSHYYAKCRVLDRVACKSTQFG